MRTDLLAISPISNTPQVWSNVWESSNRSEIFSLFVNLSFLLSQSLILCSHSVDPPFDLTSFDCKFPSPHFNAFIDLDGDCLADLFLVCQQGKSPDELSYQIWLNDKKGGFKQARKGPLPRGTRSVGFADMDRDGTIDMVLTICAAGDECSIAIAYNSQIPLCSTSPRQAAGPCRDPEALCVADPDFAFNFTPSADNHVSHIALRFIY